MPIKTEIIVMLMEKLAKADHFIELSYSQSFFFGNAVIWSFFSPSRWIVTSCLSLLTCHVQTLYVSVFNLCLRCVCVFQTFWWTCWAFLPATASQSKSWSFSSASCKGRKASGWVRVIPRWSVLVVWDLHEECASNTSTAAILQANALVPETR